MVGWKEKWKDGNKNGSVDGCMDRKKEWIERKKGGWLE